MQLAMLPRRLIEIFVCLFNDVLGEMQGHVVGGERVTIEKYPYSAFLNVWCSLNDRSSWSCGSSIINQHFTLTAAHCLQGCTGYGYISVTVGHEYIHKGTTSSAYRFKTYQKFDNFTLHADIGLVRLKTPLKFGPKIQRVILMRNPPREKVAYVAGWGLIDEEKRISSKWLKYAKQPLWSTKQCRNILGNIPEGSICAGTQKGKDYAAVGDSGSALVLKGNIQIGIVSFKKPLITTSLLVYVNVTYYYDWIVHTTAAMFCAH